jgi:hypothetical protein
MHYWVLVRSSGHNDKVFTTFGNKTIPKDIHSSNYSSPHNLSTYICTSTQYMGACSSISGSDCIASLPFRPKAIAYIP